MFRKGIAMIELIFAIVVIGITLMSAPMLISQSVKSNLIAFQQESIAMAAAQASAVMTYAWDEQNTPSETPSAILQVTNGDPQLDQNVTGDLRLLVTTKNPPQQRLRRFSTSFATPALWSDGNLTVQDNLDDIDDFNVKPLTLSIYSNALNTANKGDYIDINISIDTTVTYGRDSSPNYGGGGTPQFNIPFAASNNMPVNQSTNIKRITTVLTSTSDSEELKSKQIILQSFMCNIGAASPIQNGGY